MGWDHVMDAARTLREQRPLVVVRIDQQAVLLSAVREALGALREPVKLFETDHRDRNVGDVRKRSSVHLVLFEVNCGRNDGLDFVEKLQKLAPTTPFVICTLREYLPPALLRHLAGAESAMDKEPIALELTAQQWKVLEGLTKGSPNKAIAKHLRISPDTVKKHLSVIFGKLRVRNRTEAVVAAQQLGVLAERGAS